MYDPSLKDRIWRYLRRRPEQLVCGGEIQKLAASAGYEPQNAGRRLRELENEGKIVRELVKGKNGRKVAWYKYIPSYYEKFNESMSEMSLV